MLTIDDLKTVGVAEESIPQIMELLGDASKKLFSENIAKKAFDDVDRAVLTITGKVKGSDQKTTDYLKVAIEDVIAAKITESTTDLNTKIQEAEDKLKNHKGDESLKEEIRLLKEEKEKLPDLKADWIKPHKEEAEKYKSELEGFKRETQLRASIPKLLDGDAEFIEFKVKQALKDTEVYDRIETGSDGKVYLINSKDADKVPASDHFTEKLGALVDSGQQQKGAGAGKQQQQRQSGNTLKLEGETDGAKINEIKTHLTTQEGLDILDSKYTTRMNELFKENGLENYMTAKEKAE